MKLRQVYFIAGIGSVLVVVVYLVWAGLATPGGFPLDDAWIHQVFARNLAQHGEFSYNPGQLVAGSTSPLWTIILMPGYIFGGESYRWWAYALGIVFLALTSVEVYQLYQRLFGAGQERAGLVAALFTLFEWRLIWAGASGMETLLFTYLSLLLLRLYLGLEQEKSLRPFVWLGLIGGFLTLTRPEGVVLLGLVGLDIGRRGWLEKGGWRKLAGRWVAIIVACLALLVPYGIFNYVASGSFLPNTFQAKVNFYSADNPIEGAINYLLAALQTLFFQGPLLVATPGLILFIWQYIRGKSRPNLLPLVWVVAVLALYAWRLPVTYHNGRYLMPLIPMLMLYGVYGGERLIKVLRQARFPVLARSLTWVAVVFFLYNFGLGAVIYRFNVKFINDEQVTVGKWLRDNTPEGSIIASHDIGAIGYFSGRKLIDTAGLVSPEYVPIVRDQPAILKHLQADGVSYFAMLPTWYSDLNDQFEKENRKVFQPQETYLEQFGEKNMAIFKLR